MRIRKAVITVTLAAAAIGATASTPALAAPATAVAHNPYVGHNVGGGLLTRHALRVGQVINLVGSTGGRISNYRVTAQHRQGGVYYDTVWPRLQANGNGHLVLFTTPN